MKGISLPINTVVIIVLAMLVLVALSIYFMTSWGSTYQRSNLYTALTQGCSIWRAKGCDLEENLGNIIVDGISLHQACQNVLGNNDFKQKCYEYCCQKK